MPFRISTGTESRAHQVSTLTTETRQHRSRRRCALVFRFRPDAQSRYFPSSSAFDQLRAFYIRSDHELYKETVSICSRSSPPICSLLPYRGIFHFSLFSAYLFPYKRRVPRSENKGPREAGKPQSGNTPGDIVNIGKLEIG